MGPGGEPAARSLTEVRLTDFINLHLVDTNLDGADKVECLRRMVGMLGRQKAVIDTEAGLEKILDRERMMSTGIGDGLAIPHAKSEVMKQSRVAFGRVHRGIDFDALDGKPVHLIFLLVGPPDSASLHVKILALIARLSRKPEFRDRLMAAERGEEVIRLIREEEKKG
jgi:fructose-specific phosphotransferase system IIA component